MIYKAMFLFVLLMLVGCGGSKGSSKDGGQATGPEYDPLKPTKVVSYQSECKVESGTDDDGHAYSSASNTIIRMRKDDSGKPSIAFHEYSYGEGKCSSPFLETKVIIQGAFDADNMIFDGTYVAATDKLYVAEIVTGFNQGKVCGLTNWSINNEISVLGTECFSSTDTAEARFTEAYNETKKTFEASICNISSGLASCSHTTYSKI